MFWAFRFQIEDDDKISEKYICAQSVAINKDLQNFRNSVIVFVWRNGKLEIYKEQRGHSEGSAATESKVESGR